MALKITEKVFQISTAGTVVIPHDHGLTPECALFYMSPCATVTTGGSYVPTPHIHGGFGCVGPGQVGDVCYVWTAEDGSAITDCRVDGLALDCLGLLDINATYDYYADVSTIDATNITFNVTFTPDTPRSIRAVFFSGVEGFRRILSSRALNPAETSTVFDHNLGLTPGNPALVFGITNRLIGGTWTRTSGDMQFTYGMAVWNGVSFEQVAYGYAEDRDDSHGRPGAILETGKFFRNIEPSTMTLEWSATLTGFDANTITVGHDLGADDKILLVIIGLPSDSDASLFTFNPPSTGSNTPYNVTTFKPGNLFVMATQLEQLNSLKYDATLGTLGDGDQAGSMAFGGATATNEYSVSFCNESASDITDCSSGVSDSLIMMPNHAGVLQNGSHAGNGVRTNLVSFDANGFTLNSSAVNTTTTWWVGIAIKEAGAIAQSIFPSGIPSEEAFGIVNANPGGVDLSMIAIASLEAFGEPVLLSAIDVPLSGLPYPGISDYYPETERSGGANIWDPYDSIGQSFTGNGGPLTKAWFFLSRVGNPTGNAVAKLYAHSGTFGVSSVGTGAALATSDPVAVSTITPLPTYFMTEFVFPTPFTLVKGTHYVIVCEYELGTGTDYIIFGMDQVQPVSHPGNLCRKSKTDVWNFWNIYDGIFYAYVADFGTMQANAAEDVLPDGIVSEEAFGEISVTGPSTLNMVAIPSAEAFGIPTFTIGGVNLNPVGIASAEAFGLLDFTLGGVNLNMSGIATREEFGVPVMDASVEITNLGKIHSEEAFGIITLDTATIVNLSGIASVEAFGVINANPGNVDLFMSNIPSEEAFGITNVVSTGSQLTMVAIPSAEAFGNIALSTGLTLQVLGIESGEFFPAITMQPGVVNVGVLGIPTAEAFGDITAILGNTILPDGIVSAEAFGIPSFTVGAISFNVFSIPSAEEFGSPTLDASVLINANGIATQEAFGEISFTAAVDVNPSGVASAEAFGELIISTAVDVNPESILSQENFGQIQVVTSLASVLNMSGIQSAETFGQLIINQQLFDLVADAVIQLRTNSVIVLDKAGIKRFL